MGGVRSNSGGGNAGPPLRHKDRRAQGEVLGLCWDDLVLPNDADQEGTLGVRRQLQRMPWQHGCAAPSQCLNAAGLPAKRGADCPRRWGGGLALSEPKSTAGRRTLTLPPTLAMELRAHRRGQIAEQLASEIWEDGRHGGWVFANEGGGPLDPEPTLAPSRASATGPGSRPNASTTSATPPRR